jgi:hypothetical protein
MGFPYYRLALFFSLTLLTSFLEAATGDPITSNNYRLDLTRTVATGSTRKIGMGGAFVGLAEGNAAIPDNPAAVSYRARQFLKTWEFDMVLSSLITTDDDTDNSGSTSLLYSDYVLADAGVMAQYKNFGVGGVARTSVYSSDSLPQDQGVEFLSGNAALGFTTSDHEWAFGFSFNPIGARAKSKDDRVNRESLKLRGLGYGVGVIWHPQRGHWRFGGAYTSQVKSSEDVSGSSSPVTAGNLIVPRGVVVTDSLSMGLAYEWDNFPLWQGRAAVATFDTRIFGPSPSDANSTKAFLNQTEAPVGQKTIVTLHGGLEAEAIPKWLRLRVGTYYEPSRYDGISPRQHITGGFEFRATKFRVWGERPLAISYAIDYAARYQVHSISIWLYTFTVPVASGK